MWALNRRGMEWKFFKGIESDNKILGGRWLRNRFTPKASSRKVPSPSTPIISPSTVQVPCLPPGLPSRQFTEDSSFTMGYPAFFEFAPVPVLPSPSTSSALSYPSSLVTTREATRSR
jgi:hypothetical protein